MEQTNAVLLNQLREISVCQLLDAVGSDFPVETAIFPLDPGFRVCGRVVTALCAPDDNLTLHHALHVSQPGQVLVAQAKGSLASALWGELMSLSASQRGLEGTIIDGAARDRHGIQTIGYPVFTRGLTPRRAAKEIYGSLNVPIRCGCLLIHPGDVVVADANGIVTIPADRLQETVEAALMIAQKEREIEKYVTMGGSIFHFLRLDNRIPHNSEKRDGVQF